MRLVRNCIFILFFKSEMKPLRYCGLNRDVYTSVLILRAVLTALNNFQTFVIVTSQTVYFSAINER